MVVFFGVILLILSLLGLRRGVMNQRIIIAHNVLDLKSIFGMSHDGSFDMLWTFHGLFLSSVGLIVYLGLLLLLRVAKLLWEERLRCAHLSRWWTYSLNSSRILRQSMIPLNLQFIVLDMKLSNKNLKHIARLSHQLLSLFLSHDFAQKDVRHLKIGE